jgi:hypothetical protein
MCTNIFFNSYMYLPNGVNGPREFMASNDERKLLAVEWVSFVSHILYETCSSNFK